MDNLLEKIEQAEESALALLPGYKISITNKQGRYIVDMRTRLLIRRAITAALRHEYIPEDRFAPEVSVMLVSDRRIHMLNIETRGIDRATDVLSFPMFELTPGELPEDWSEYRDPATHKVPLGDMAISLERAKAQAAEFGHSAEREVGYLTIHSVLHLLGYDHVDEGPMKKQMRAREEAILAEVELPRA